ncbi:MAG: glycosyl hydrolase-related protein [Lentisphaeria bacterium]|nr:glycosyl hydrolase-related protein [Lentisphaeria bacterium]
MIQNQFNEIMTRLDNFYARSEEDLFAEYAPVTAEVAVTDDPVSWKERKKLAYRSVSEGDAWGTDWQSGWFHLQGRVPASWKGGNLVMRLNLGGEAMIFDAKGNPEYAVTNTSVYHPDFYKEVYYFDKPAQGGEKIDLWVEGAANNILGPQIFDWNPHPDRAPYPHGHSVGQVKYMRLALYREELFHFRLEFKNLYFYAKYFLHADAGNCRCRQIVQALSDALDAYRGNPDNAAAARAALKPVLSQPAMASALKCTAIGHAHIDVGWLWPVRESVRKAARTFCSQLKLMERYPEHRFGESQPQLYQFIKDFYPGLYKRIQKAVKDGKWECQGGMWVEADNNLPSGESLIRQFLHGKNFFKDEFGVEVRNLWLPDVFGYNGNTPQIMKICGCDFFLTQKLSWNTINTHPYNTFRWRGIDSSEVVTHFPPENNYNSFLDSNSLAQAQNRYLEAATCPEFLSLFGIGDGGGGPNEIHLENGRLSRNWEGTPKVTLGFAQPLFDRMIAMKEKLSIWYGELYFENHRGTLTSQARTKKNNRKLEQRLLQAEFLASLLPARKYPRALLDKICKTLLLNQFHDIIPGSSIRPVYDRTEREHAECLAALATMLQDTAVQLMKPNANALTLFNSLSTPYSRPVELPKSWAKGKVTTAVGEAVVTQVESDGRVFAAVVVPASGFLTLFHKDGKGQAVKTKMDGKLLLENGKFRYEFDVDGRMTSAVEKSSEQEFLTAPGNAFHLYHDETAIYDAWNVDPWYRGEEVAQAKSAGAVVREVGPVRSILRFELGVSGSAISQEVSLAATGESVEFKTAVEWHEARKMLRVAFPTSVDSREATYDIQYGMIKRPTHNNTSRDQVQFEVCGHRYADLSDGERGVALLNDCKYGYFIKESVMELNLLRSPKWPDFDADQGRQEFTYALRPHLGTVIEAPIYAEAAQLNREPWAFEGLDATALAVPVSVTGEGVSLEVVKRAEKSDDLIVRIVETRGRHTTGTLALAKTAKFKKVSLTNAIEWTDDGEVPLVKGACSFALKPFQIMTLRLA